MFPTPSGRKTFVVTCKRCRRDIPSGVREFPFQSITVECPLCSELRRYLPSEVFLGLTNSSPGSGEPEADSASEVECELLTGDRKNSLGLVAKNLSERHY